VEHMEWFAKAGELPPARIYFGCLAHMVMLLGYIVAFRHEFTGSIFIIIGSFILFSRINSASFIVFFLTASVPALLYLVHWYKTAWESSVVRALIYGSDVGTISPQVGLSVVISWILRIAGTFISFLIAAYWFGGEEFFVLFKPGEGWTLSMSEGFPNPFVMTGAEIALLCLSATIIAGFLAAWKWEIAGGVAVVVVSALYALIARDAAVYPVLPATPVAGVLFILTGRYIPRVASSKENAGGTEL